MRGKYIEATEQYIDKAEKLMEGYQTLSEIEEIDVATSPKEEVWRDGKIVLYKYKRERPATVSTPLLITYALVNRQDMMDLQPDRSLIRKFIDLGLEIYMIDWGYVTRADRYTSMDDYINHYLGSCVDYVRQAHQLDKINLLGVCQGGTFSVIYTSLYPEKIKNLITMVAPIDFSPNDGLLFRWARDMDVDALVDNSGGIISGDFLNAGFDMLKPLAKMRKYTNLADMMDSKNKLLNFLRMEKWVADSPDQAGECFRQFIKEFYQENRLVEGNFKLNGEAVLLKNITMPLLNIYAAADHIVPPACTIPLEKHVSSKDVQTYEFPGGHIGVFVGSRSQKELSPTIVDWLKKRDQ
ncbi:MAG: class III poly(R)-hydroxyalkanoic acid synthase subunit PhaC [Thermonemataceae bacterium]